MMPDTLRRIQFVLFTLACLVNCYSASDDMLLAEQPSTLAKPVPTAAELTASYERLSAASFSEREQGMDELFAAGEAAFPYLARGLVSAEPEIAWRCDTLLCQIAFESDLPTLQRVAALLKQSAAQGKPHLAQQAEQLQQRAEEVRQARAIRRLTALGSEVTLPDEEYAEVAFEADIIAIDALEFEIEDDPFAMEAEAFPINPPDIFSAILEPIFAPRMPQIDGAGEELQIAQGAEVEFVPPVAKNISNAILGSLLPGRVGEGVQRALGLGDRRLGGAGREIDPFDDPAAPEPFFPAGRALADLLPAEPLAEEPMAAILDREAEVDVEVEDFFIPAAAFIPGVIDLDVMGEATGRIVINENWKGDAAELAALKDIRHVGTVFLSHAPLGDNALEHIGTMPDLKLLQVRNVKFSAAALRKFHREHPRVALMAMGKALMGVNAHFEPKKCRLITVFEGSGAHAAGLKEGDEILSINGEEIRNFSELTIAIYEHLPQDQVTVRYRRDQQEQETVVTLKARPS